MPSDHHQTDLVNGLVSSLDACTVSPTASKAVSLLNSDDSSQSSTPLSQRFTYRCSALQSGYHLLTCGHYIQTSDLVECTTNCTPPRDPYLAHFSCHQCAHDKISHVRELRKTKHEDFWRKAIPGIVDEILQDFWEQLRSTHASDWEKEEEKLIKKDLSGRKCDIVTASEARGKVKVTQDDAMTDTIESSKSEEVIQSDEIDVDMADAA